MKRVLSKINEFTGKKHIQLTDRGNTSIDIVLALAKRLGKKTVLIPDQGGWIHYQKAPQRFGLATKEIKTDDGLIDLKDLEKNSGSESILLSCSMPGYFAVDDVDKILEICEKNGCLFVNDASGSIGTDAAKVGHIVLGSFGEDKPVNLLYGGFIATDDLSLYTEFDASYFDEKKYDALLAKFSELPGRLKRIEEKRKQIIEDLESFNIVHKDKHGLNVVVKFDDEESKQRIVDYCKENNVEFTECPRYIRINSNAISIEVKRL